MCRQHKPPREVISKSAGSPAEAPRGESARVLSGEMPGSFSPGPAPNPGGSGLAGALRRLVPRDARVRTLLPRPRPPRPSLRPLRRLVRRENRRRLRPRVSRAPTRGAGVLPVVRKPGAPPLAKARRRQAGRAPMDRGLGGRPAPGAGTGGPALPRRRGAAPAAAGGGMVASAVCAKVPGRSGCRRLRPAAPVAPVLAAFRARGVHVSGLRERGHGHPEADRGDRQRRTPRRLAQAATADRGQADWLSATRREPTGNASTCSAPARGARHGQALVSPPTITARD